MFLRSLIKVDAEFTQDTLTISMMLFALEKKRRLNFMALMFDGKIMKRVGFVPVSLDEFVP